MSDAIPRTFEAWRHCIEHDCGQPLDLPFIERRLAALRAPQGEEARRFVRLYGEAHWRNVLSWFEQAKHAAPR
jgi:hypothetical protein